MNTATDTLASIPATDQLVSIPSSKRGNGSSARFEAVRDSRKRKVAGLWRRGDRYYAQLRVDLGNGRTAPRRIPLEVATLDEARAALRKKQNEKHEQKLRAPGRRPKFQDFAQEYFAGATFMQKKPRTQDSERQAIKRWMEHLGGLRLDRITTPIIESYREKRLRAGTAARTVNLDVIALRQVLALAKQRGLLDDLLQFFSPKHGGDLKALKHRDPLRRTLLTKEQFVGLLDAATHETTKNSDLLRFYLRFLALTGAREQEALEVRRCDVDFKNGLVVIGATGNAKNSKSRAIDFSRELETVLREMESWLPPDTSWLFPSPQRGAKDIHAETLRESFKAVRKKAGLEWVGFHDLRHMFASRCVMAGIDHMTTAAWLGHSDGGILVGKVYGHLADTHKKAAAQKLKFLE